MEIWKPVLGFEGFYEASNFGNVRSLKRVNKKNNKLLGGNLLKPILGTRKYLVVNLTKPGTRKQIFLHKVIIEAFYGQRPQKMTVCHNDGNKLNCQLNNLRWAAQIENIADKKIHGTWQFGERIGNSRFTDQQIIEIRQKSLSPSEIVRRYGGSKTNAKRIASGKTWRHINVEQKS